MYMTDKSKAHVDACRFCWMCHHICPIGNATGHERSTPRGRALGISLVNRNSIELEEIMDNIYECAGCGACVHDCVTGWDPVMFTREVRNAAALEGKLPAYIEKLVDNCLDTGNAYGTTVLCEGLQAAIAAHAGKTDTLLLLGADARYKACKEGKKAINVLEKANVEFTVLADEGPIGTQLNFLVGALEETTAQMRAMAEVCDAYKTVVVFDPDDAKTIIATYGSLGIDVKANVVTYPAYLASLLASGALKAAPAEKRVVVQDHFALARDLDQTEDVRTVVKAYAQLDEMLLSGKETVWAGNVLMAQYMPEIIDLVAKRRIFNATSVGATTIVCESPSEYTALKAVAEDIEILSLADLIL